MMLCLKVLRSLNQSSRVSRTLYRIDSQLLASAHCLQCQKDQNLSTAAKIVEKAPSKIKPYMKLMRIDKPIGKLYPEALLKIL